jgi:hypothetical protein
MSEPENDQEYSLLMRFLNDSLDFVLGYECGQLWERMEDKKPIDQNIHSANVEQIRVMADIHSYRVEFEEYAPALDHKGTYKRLLAAPGEPQH